MDTDALKTSVLVAQLGSFAAAARALNLDPSSVSRTVAAVEEKLGLRLFQRTTRRLTLTEEGEIYLRRIAPLLEELDSAHDLAGGARDAPSGTLKLTASVAFTQECIVPLLREFHALYPDLTLELLASDANIDLLAESVDLAVRLAPAPAGDLISTRLLQTRYRVCASPDYLETHGPIETPSDLERIPCLRPALPGFRSRWLFRQPGKAPFGVPISGRLLISSGLALRQAALDGHGPALLADWLIARDLAEGRLVDVFPAYDSTATEFDTGAWALYPSRTFLPRKVRVTIDFLRERLPRAAAVPGR
ncbi:LysR family transcriptional regulator [Roseibium sp.]|uniref:LysR family transcriptional regulator n=1 Tax=Roseibium sp. TaxID=1936156 RepID=UPI003A97EE8A